MRASQMKNIQIFRHTQSLYNNNETLKEVIQNSIAQQKVYYDHEEIDISPVSKKGAVIVSEKRSLEASEVYAKQGKKVCVLNFASAMNPGGGVVYGASAQEEAICRCSTLYPCIDDEQMWLDFYLPHRKKLDCLHNDDCIYTPKVKVIKTDTNEPMLLAERDWWEVDIITCAVPDVRMLYLKLDNPLFQQQLKAILKKRIEKIFKVAIDHQVDVLILGAFGCGGAMCC